MHERMDESESAFSRSRRPSPGRAAIVMTFVRSNPLLAVASGLAIGIALDAAWPIPLPLVLTCFLASTLAILFRRGPWYLSPAALVLASVASGAILHDMHFRRWPVDHLVQYTEARPIHAHVTGRVLTPPVIRESTGHVPAFAQLPQTRFVLWAESIRGRDGNIPVSGKVAVVLREPHLTLRAGDRIELSGKIYRPRPSSNPGSTDWALLRRQNGILVEASAEHAASVRIQQPAPDNPWTLAELRRRARVALLGDLYPREVPGSQVLSAMVLGQRSRVDPDLNQAFVDAGTVHYLSVSGAHVGMLASVVWGAGLLAGYDRRTIAWIAMGTITAYALLAEPRAPIIRAAVMADTFCLAVLLRRPLRSVNWMAAAAIMLLILDPCQLFRAGFQLSFVTVWSVIFLSPHVHAWGSAIWKRWRHGPHADLLLDLRRRVTDTKPTWLQHISHALSWYVAVAFSAWSVSVLLASWHFQQVSMWGWLGSLLAMPLVWLALVLGLIKTVLSMIAPPLGALPAPLLTLVTDGLIALVQAVAALPGSGMRTSAVPAWLVISGLLIVGVVSVKRRLRLPSRWIVPAGLAWLVLLIFAQGPKWTGGALRLQVLSVGSGTTTVIHLPDGRAMLYDIGSHPPYDVEKWTLGPYLAHERVARLDTVFLSHPNWDHYGGLFEVLPRRKVLQIVTTPYFRHLSTPDSLPGRLHREVIARHIPWSERVRGDRLIEQGEVTIDVLWPPPIEEGGFSEANESSLVLRITYGNQRILLCGDIQEQAQSQLIMSADLQADVLLLPHHGGVDPTTTAFIEAVNPAICIRSSGQRDDETRNGLLDLVAGRTYYNTADHGAIEVTLSKTGVQCTSFLR